MWLPHSHVPPPPPPSAPSPLEEEGAKLKRRVCRVAGPICHGHHNAGATSAMAKPGSATVSVVCGGSVTSSDSKTRAPTGSQDSRAISRPVTACGAALCTAAAMCTVAAVAVASRGDACWGAEVGTCGMPSRSTETTGEPMVSGQAAAAAKSTWTVRQRPIEESGGAGAQSTKEMARSVWFGMK